MAALVTALLVIDPNSYKDELTALAEDHSNLQLELAGDINWSLQPLGFELHQVSAKLQDNDFLTLDSIVAKADLWSLLRWQPRVETFVLRGLKSTLIIDAQGSGNWEKILKEKTTASTQTQVPAETADSPSTALQFNIREIVIEDARIHYTDQRNNQSLLLDNINLTATDSAFDQPFPLQLAFRFANADIGVRAELQTRLTVAADLQQFTVEQLQGSAELSGAALNHQTVNARLATSLTADLRQYLITLSELNANFANLQLQGKGELSQFNQTPVVNGELSIDSFSLRQLLGSLGQAIPDTSDPTVLNKLALSTRIESNGQTLALKPLKLTLDDTHMQGDLHYRLADGKLGGTLEATALNADRYLPPASKNPEASAPPAANPAAAAETDLLPLETLRQLLWDWQLGLKQLIVNGLTLNDLKVRSTAAGGILRLEQFSAKLYQGSLQASAQLDARSDIPEWRLQPQLAGIQTGPLLQDLAEVTLLSGAADITADIRSRGNRPSALRQQAKGIAELSMAQGVIDGVSTSAMACEAIALVHKEGIQTGDWPRSTAFTDLKGLLQINGNTLNNTKLSAQVTGLNLGGSGSIQIEQMLMDYRAGLTINGPVHEDPSCRINDKLMGLRIPVKCSGPLASDDAEGSPSLCKFDNTAFRETLENLAKAEVQRKAKKKAEEKIDKMLGTGKGEESDPRKEAIKGLLKDWGR